MARSGNGMTLPDLARYADRSQTYVKQAAECAVELGFATKQNANRQTCIYIPTARWRHDSEQYERSHGRDLFASYLAKWSPFQTFLRFVLDGSTPHDATTKLSVLLGQQIPTMASETLLRWAQSAGFIETDESGRWVLVAKSKTGPSQHLSRFRNAAMNEISARDFLYEHLGQATSAYLDTVETDELVNSLLKPDPRDAIDSFGRALEDFLRRLGNSGGLPLNREKGIEEIANTLVSANIIEQKQQKLLAALSTARVACAHSKERKSLQRWEIRAEFATGVILLGLETMRSVHMFVTEGQRDL